ncbi:MAG TPA: ABC transporter ATP-binding protein, partial [Planctomycetota bacterium]|nr:ABC transporter ATP-binding protein [Planctomycetota bacterium]
MKVFRRFIAYFLREKRWLLFGTLCLIPASVLDLSLPLVVKRFFDRLGTERLADLVWTTFWIYIALAALKGVFRFGMRWLLVTSSRRVEANIRNDLFRHLETLSFPYFNRTKTGDLISRATQDVEAVRMFLGPGFMYAGDALVRIPLALAVLATVQPVLLVAMALSLTLLVVAVRRLTPRLHRDSEAVQESLGDVSQRANETFAGIRVVKAFAREESSERHFDEASSRYRRKSLDLISGRALSDVFFSGAKDVTMLVLYAGAGLLLLRGRTTVGELYLFADYTTRLYWPVFVVGWMVAMYPRARAAAKRLEEVLTTVPEIADAATTGASASGDGNGVPSREGFAALRGDVEVRRLTFSYGPDRPPALRDVSFRVRAGETVAIVGRTGSGKSTLASLLGRFFPVPPGTIFVDGIDVNALPLRRLRGALGYVPQDHFLFSDTIRENVGFAAPAAADAARASAAASAAALDEDLAGFPKGLDTEIGERGVTLSGGQRQRVGIARALYADPRILVIDDALSAVDVSTEETLLENLRRAA